MSSYTLLIVDDEEFIRKSFFYYFEDREWTPIMADSGESALKILEKESPDAIIVDMRMTGMDGNAFIKEVCKTKKIATLICTGSSIYRIPEYIAKQSCVSKSVFKKPVVDIPALEKELIRMIKKVKAE